MKEIIITASGEKVPPRPLEEAIKRELPIISNAIVIGDQQRFLCCLVTLKVCGLLIRTQSVCVLIGVS